MSIQQPPDGDSTCSEVTVSPSDGSDQASTSMPTPMPTSVAKQPSDDVPATPSNNRTSARKLASKTSVTPSREASATSATRQRRPSTSQKVQPTLLSDFLLGRQTQTRVSAARAAKRQKSIDAAAVKLEMRSAMRQSSVRRLQQPGGVKARVKTWQKRNAAQMVAGNPEAAPSEPTDVAFDSDEKSVTETDRIRIKSRRKPRPCKIPVRTSAAHPTTTDNKGIDYSEGSPLPKTEKPTTEDNDEWEDDGDHIMDKGEAHRSVPHLPQSPQSRKNVIGTRLGSPPKKRIVSDDNWMKRKNRARTSPKAASPKAKLSSKATPSPIPKDFLQRTARNPSVEGKIKDWVNRIELPEIPTRQKHGDRKGTVEEDDYTDPTDNMGVMGSSRSAPDDDGIRVRPVQPARSVEYRHGKHQRESKVKAHITPDSLGDATRTPPAKSVLADDEIRIQSGRAKTLDDHSSIITPSPDKKKNSHMTTYFVQSAPEPRIQTDKISIIHTESTNQDGTSTPYTPTRKPRSKRSPPVVKQRPRRSSSPTEAPVEDGVFQKSSLDNETENVRLSVGEDSYSSQSSSDEPSTVLAKSLAEIPVGFSAFSELDIPLRGEAAKAKARAQRNASFKGVPQVLRKVVNEGKKIIHDKVDPPRLVANQPRSIENWLNGTVDPFIDASSPRKPSSSHKRQSMEEEWKHDVRSRSSSEPQRPEAERSPLQLPQNSQRKGQENHASRSPNQKASDRVASATTPTKQAASDENLASPSTPKATSGLKRSGATRSSSSPLKTTSAKKPFRDVLREAFRGESGNYKTTISPYHSFDTDRDRDRGLRSVPQDGYERGYNDKEEPHQPHRHSSGGSEKTATFPLSIGPASAIDSEETSSFASSATHSSGYPHRRPPPTSGEHELSTIVSVESFSSQPSNTMSTISESTVTQATGLTKVSGNASQQRRSKVSAAGLKRRLTKHSDLVSVLSLPEDAQLPARTKSIKRARSLHRKTSKLDSATLDDLLQEFSEDENLYQRELKTLVDGVIPVLLTQFVGASACKTAEVFRVGSDLQKADAMAKAVVDMGVVLESLEVQHKRVPLYDAPRMVNWLDAIYSLYDQYLDVWRLGFQGIIVNLAPATGKLDDEDSLINAMALNEDGDVLDENGERVDVAYLLRRPLVRIKWMLKFAKGIGMVLGGGLAGDTVKKLDILHDKARRRQREEIARRADEDASATDTTRARGLRNLVALDNVRIDQSRQVNAKDWFDLDLSHSNGQRLECQVELIFRDKPGNSSDLGDVLIRETGGGGRSWLLFPPLSIACMSARRGQDPRSLVVMVRDVHDSHEWYELLTLVADHNDTAEDWLGILGTNPVPPVASVPTLPVSSPHHGQSSRTVRETDIPLGERRSKAEPGPDPGASTLRGSPTAPIRYHKREKSGRPATTPTPSRQSARAADNEETTKQSTEDERLSSGQQHHLLSKDVPATGHDLMDPVKRKSSSRSVSLHNDSIPPPPPAHRILRSLSPPTLSPPTETPASSSRVRRRTSSPLKHECHPSDISSESDSTTASSESESESSIDGLDELEEDDVPDTLPGISIRKTTQPFAESIISDNSITPSNSASQAGLPQLQASSSSEYTLQFMASISYWSNKKGTWKDLGEPISAITITPGLIEAFLPGTAVSDVRLSPGLMPSSNVELDAGAPRPLIALDLTPLVMIRQSTVIDLEIRSPVRSYSKYKHLDASIFRFRASSPAELGNLYMAVHQSRLNNAKFKALEEEARFRSFGQPQVAGNGGDDNNSHRRRSWFGRKNSYRASTRAPSQSQGSTSSISATSFLRKFAGGNNSFNIGQSSIDKQSRAGSGGGASFYTSSGSSSAAGGQTPPRSPSVSLAESSNRGIQALGSSDIKTRCHLQVSANKWEDHGNCTLTILRPPPGVRQELTIYHGLEKRILVVTIPKKDSEKPMVVVDVVVGSACFSRLAARGIVLNVWEEMRDEHNRVGAVPAAGAISGRVRKWCFQFSSAAVAGWVYGLVASEVEIA